MKKLSGYCLFRQISVGFLPRFFYFLFLIISLISFFTVQTTWAEETEVIIYFSRFVMQIMISSPIAGQSIIQIGAANVAVIRQSP